MPFGQGDFMKNILFGILMTITTVGANASMLEINGPLDQKFYNAEVNEDKSYFDTLGDMFSVGTKPSPSKLINNLWAGRCFYKSEPNDPKNGAYIFRKVVSDAGPISSGTQEYEAIAIRMPSKGPNYFDKLTLEYVQASLDGSLYQRVTSTANSLVITNPSIVELKLSGKYLVVEGRSVENAGPISKPGDAFGRCYYFIPEYIP